MGIAEAYKEALNAMEYKFVVGEHEIIAYEDISEAEQTPLPLSYYYPIQCPAAAYQSSPCGRLFECRGNHPRDYPAACQSSQSIHWAGQMSDVQSDRYADYYIK